MQLEKLKNFILNGESESLEFKKTTGQRTEAAKTVCAFLNGFGGFVIFGVSDRGELGGQQVTNKTLEDLAIELRRIEPPAFPEIETIVIEEDKKIILIRVNGEQGTYTYDGRPYLRHGPTTQIMPRSEYERRLLERLHASKPWNPIIAEVFYRAGVIEQWGTGTLNILEWCKENQNPSPIWSEQAGTVAITFLPSTFFLKDIEQTPTTNKDQSTGQVTGQDKILKFCEQPKTAKEIMTLIGLKHRESFANNYLKPLLQKKLLSMTIPDKPNSKNQKYFTNHQNRSLHWRMPINILEIEQL